MYFDMESHWGHDFECQSSLFEMWGENVVAGKGTLKYTQALQVLSPECPLRVW